MPVQNFKYYFFLALVFLSNLSNASDNQILLSVGEKKQVFSLEALTLSQNKVIQVKDLGKSFLFQGLKPGFTTVRLGKKLYEIFVLSENQKATYQLLQDILKHKLGLEVRLAQGQVELSGKLINLQDWFEISDHCQKIQCDYIAKFDIRETQQKFLQKKISLYLQSYGLNAYQIRWIPDIHLVLSDQIKSSDPIYAISKRFGFRISEEKNALELAPTVEVRILIAEIKKRNQEMFGLDWPTSYATKILPSFDGLSNEAELTLKALTLSGAGRVLASPRIICRSGKESEFLAGGEIPIKIISQKTADVIWKKYGIVLKFKPQADFSGRMSLGIETEISKIDLANSVDGIPGFETSRVQSHFDLVSNQVIALSGLLRMDQGESTQGVSMLAKLPIIGSLFSSVDFQRHETELVIFVQPRVIQPQ